MAVEQIDAILNQLASLEALEECGPSGSAKSGGALRIKLDKVRESLDGHQFWGDYLDTATSPDGNMGVHVAVFSEPFLSLVLEKRKTVESRFSRNRCSPYGEIHVGDIILIKKVAGPICGLTLAKKSWCYDLARESIETLKKQFGSRICASDDFWLSQSGAAYATLIELSETVAIKPLLCDKKDRRGWVSLRIRQKAFVF